MHFGEKNLYIVTEYAKAGDLHRRIQKFKKAKEAHARRSCMDIHTSNVCRLAFITSHEDFAPRLET